MSQTTNSILTILCKPKNQNLNSKDHFFGVDHEIKHRGAFLGILVTRVFKMNMAESRDNEQCTATELLIADQMLETKHISFFPYKKMIVFFYYNDPHFAHQIKAHKLAKDIKTTQHSICLLKVSDIRKSPLDAKQDTSVSQGGLQVIIPTINVKPNRHTTKQTICFHLYRTVCMKNLQLPCLNTVSPLLDPC